MFQKSNFETHKAARFVARPRIPEKLRWRRSYPKASIMRKGFAARGDPDRSKSSLMTNKSGIKGACRGTPATPPQTPGSDLLFVPPNTPANRLTIDEDRREPRRLQAQPFYGL